MKGIMGKDKIRKMEEKKLLKLDLGAGKNGKEGFLKVDIRKFDGVDVVCNLGIDTWPWPDNSTEEAHCSHMLEHLEPMERVHFFNELYRVLKWGGKCQLITPHWASCRAYGDMTHKWPPVSEFFWYYLNQEWRASNAPHNDFYTCDFDSQWGYSLHPLIVPRNQEYQTFAMNFYKEAVMDMICTVTSRKKEANVG